MKQNFDRLQERNSLCGEVDMQKVLWDTLLLMNKSPFMVGNSIATIDQFHGKYPPLIDKYIRGSSENPVCFTMYPDPSVGLDFFIPKSFIIHGDIYGMCEKYEIEYHIINKDELEHQWFAYSESVRQLRNCHQRNYKLKLKEAESQLKSYFIFALNYCVEVLSVSNK